jgi:hypothetical protein
MMKGEFSAFVLLSIGLVTLWFALYLLIGKLECILGPDKAEWTRLFLKRWSTQSLSRDGILSIGTSVRIRTNGRPTSWSVHFTTRDKKPLPAWMQERFPITNPAFHDRSRQKALPGSWNESTVFWLGTLLQRWSGKPFDTGLDRTVENSE